MRNQQTLPGTKIWVAALLTLGLFFSTVQSQPIATHPLAKQKNCGGCHAENIRVAGLSWTAIRERYNHLDTNYLGRKILSGGGGAWGILPKPRRGGTSATEVTENEALFLVGAMELPQGSQPTVVAPAPRPDAPSADDPKVFAKVHKAGSL